MVCNFVNLKRVNWKIHLVNNLFTLLNEGLEVVETLPNPSPFFLKKLINKIIELLSIPLLYSPSFF